MWSVQLSAAKHASGQSFASTGTCNDPCSAGSECLHGHGRGPVPLGCTPPPEASHFRLPHALIRINYPLRRSSGSVARSSCSARMLTRYRYVFVYLSALSGACGARSDPTPSSLNTYQISRVQVTSSHPHAPGSWATAPTRCITQYGRQCPSCNRVGGADGAPS